MGPLYEHQNKFLTISLSILRMKNVLDKRFREYQCTLLCSKFSFENPAVYEIMWKNTVQPDKPRMTVWRMRIACWIPKATDIHSEYVKCV